MLGIFFADREQARTKNARRVIGPGRLESILIEYHELLDWGYAVNPEPPPNPPGKQGRPARGKSLNPWIGCGNIGERSWDFSSIRDCIPSATTRPNRTCE